MDARTLIAQLQQRVQGQIDGDQVLPDDGSSLLALLNRAREALSLEHTAAARAGIEAFISRVLALIEVGALDVADGRLLIEAAAPLRAGLPSEGGTSSEPRRGPGDSSGG